MDQDTFVKRAARCCPGQPEYEATGLKWLGDGAQVPKVFSVSASELVTQRLYPISASPEAAVQLGEMLARMHALGAPNFGAPPRAFESPDPSANALSDAYYQGPGYMGLAPLPLIEPGSDDVTPSWGEFYARWRILPYLDDTFAPAEAEVIKELASALESGALNHPEPKLVRERGFEAARIHGDLWTGNVMWTGDGPYLIDPAAQGGHAEEDFGALATFGAPYFEQIVEGYQGVSALAPGWRERIPLHQMHILMVHCYLFGKSYIPRTLNAARAALETL